VWSLPLALGPAGALSWLPADPVAALAVANAAQETDVVVRGSFSGGPGPRPFGTINGTPRTYEAEFTGQMIGRTGPGQAITRRVAITEGCAGSWCAELPMDRDMLTFIEVETGGLPRLYVGACYSNIFQNPTPEQMESVQTCFELGCTAS